MLVAFTIEFDNEFERRMPHRTTLSNPAGGPRLAPRLVSLVMWSNLLRFTGMERWGYVSVASDPSDERAKPMVLHRGGYPDGS